MEFGLNFSWSLVPLTRKLDRKSVQGERSERASAASDVSGAMEVQPHGANCCLVGGAMGVQRHGANCRIMVSVCIFFILARFPFLAKTGLRGSGIPYPQGPKP